MIARRLRQRDTGLRTSGLSLLCSISSSTRHSRIKKFECEILLKPKISIVCNLHILSRDLILHKRTLEPIRTVIYRLQSVHGHSHGHSHVIFWIIMLPAMAIVLPIFIVSVIKRMIHYVKKHLLTKKVVKVRLPSPSLHARI
ncbi:hypothetical protein C8R44DRAFT_894437 [Mycena epipterygia]|nr:hypothetical protein C8R44DRAFT_894437 [Mycena epipterygia]